ncbi:hypothetical protein TWF173_003646 [Orbilia oligospora]|uniref:PhoD-like phosphatase metallophosphatase domain-containing protein n=1 Tax=Arthrobotrys oligospora (strain ATCC 24927 / CBS 115.81 / DSM 1491) TaxID=756982 RepID=G1X5P5_ARTOA|nr:hypothetical protein AOL_s00054g189 [Orbilia oligospora ATCC 24927]EGX51490.1 hypothetical protein AOL_s00054g189 [Orbilia oligospora ATCC 24927]KAF3319196.1 hypothetical protein TWF173_003646 [Orbilia oligospora]
MKSAPVLAILSLLPAGSFASWAGNINYLSPSMHHPSLGISIRRVAKRNVPGTEYTPQQLNFTHGVASGDPHASSVILWTRAAPMMHSVNDDGAVTGLSPMFWHGPEVTSTAPVCVEWKVAKDKAMKQTVCNGKAYTSSDIDFTVKVEAKHLKPFTNYYYQFNICNSNIKSPIGRTKTAPGENDHLARARFAVYSCAFYAYGYFNAYGQSARKDSVDYVLHLGDYIYEYARYGYTGEGPDIDRVPQPEHELFTLYDYRERFATHRTDEDLLLSHRMFPWIATWDDHEVANNAWRDGHFKMNNTENTFIEDDPVSVGQRKMNAVRAYFEWMPIRQVDMDDNLRIWRSTAFGDLVDLVMLDTRHYDRSITTLWYNDDYISKISGEPNRSQMGPRQESWFFRQLSESHKRGTTWRLVGSQTVFSYLNLGDPSEPDEPSFRLDAWQGYTASRNRTLHHLYSNNIPNNIVLAGDSHASWVSDLVWLNSTDPDPRPEDHPDYDPRTGRGSIGVEFASTSVASPGIGGWDPKREETQEKSDLFIKTNPSLQWTDQHHRGYMELDISHEKVKTTYFGIPSVLSRNRKEIQMAQFEVYRDENKVHRPAGGFNTKSGSAKKYPKV